MNNNDVRNAIALEAEKRIGMNRFDLGYRCEETCCEGVSDVLKEVFNNNNLEGLCTSYSCNTLYGDMSDSEYWYEPEDWMDRGDIIFFDWDRTPEEKPLDHVGICIGIEGELMEYVNINGSDHNKWTVQTISKHNVSIAKWMRYINPTPKPDTTPDIKQYTEDIYKVIEKLQALRDDITTKIDMYIRSLKNIK